MSTTHCLLITSSVTIQNVTVKSNNLISQIKTQASSKAVLYCGTIFTPQTEIEMDR